MINAVELWNKIQKQLKNMLFNNTSKNCVLFNSVQEFTEIEAWLPLTFFLCLHNQLTSIHFFVTC